MNPTSCGQMFSAKNPKVQRRTLVEPLILRVWLGPLRYETTPYCRDFDITGHN
jgi:hypothetical protein